MMDMSGMICKHCHRAIREIHLEGDKDYIHADGNEAQFHSAEPYETDAQAETLNAIMQEWIAIIMSAPEAVQIETLYRWLVLADTRIEP